MKRNLITPAFSLDAPVGMDRGPNANAPGVICAANEARFTSTHYSEPLTGYTVGWRDPENLDELNARLFPEISHGRMGEFKAATNADEWLSDTDDERAIGASFKRVERKGTTVLFKTQNRGLTVRVDHDEVDALDGNWQEMYVGWLLRRLARSRLKRGIALIDAAATNANRTWTGANPDGLLRTTLKATADATGMRANVVVFGEAAWDLRLDVYEPANTPYAARAASMSPAELATKLMVDRVEVVKARYQSAASAKTNVIGSVVYHYYAEMGQMKDDPSNVKRFVTSARGGVRNGVYVQEHEKFTDISVEAYDVILIASSLGVRKDTVS